MKYRAKHIITSSFLLSLVCWAVGFWMLELASRKPKVDVCWVCGKPVSEFDSITAHYGYSEGDVSRKSITVHKSCAAPEKLLSTDNKQAFVQPEANIFYVLMAVFIGAAILLTIVPIVIANRQWGGLLVQKMMQKRASNQPSEGTR